MARSFLLLALFATTALAETDPALRPAAYADLNVSPAASEVRFTKRPTVLGDRVDHVVKVALDLNSTSMQNAQVVSQKDSRLGRLEERTVLVEEIVEGRPITARVHFQTCERILGKDESERQPTTGNTYICRRTDTNEPLEITRADGSFASPEEFEIVSESMSSLGKPNPLSDFLAGQVVRVGQTLQLPEEAGQGLLGASEGLGVVDKFELKLIEIVEPNNVRVARFEANIEAVGDSGRQMRMAANGIIEVEVDSLPRAGNQPEWAARHDGQDRQLQSVEKH